MSNPYYRVGQYYVDDSTPTSPVLWRCITAGDKTSSAWAKVSGGTGGALAPVNYANASAYAAGQMVFVSTQITVSSVIILPGCYISAIAVPGTGTGNQIPQFPYPTSGTLYWYLICPIVVPVNICTSTGTAQVYIPSTASF